MRFPIAGVILGLFGTVAGAAGLALVAWGLLRRSRRGHSMVPDETGQLMVLAALVLVAVALIGYGVNVVARSLQARRIEQAERRSRPPEAELAARPWLRNAQWRRREIEFSSPVRDSVLFLAFVFFGLPALGFLWVGLANPVMHDGGHLPLSERAGYLGMGAVLAFALGGLVYLRVRRARYGTSVCRLLTLPAVVGGALEADVECALPPGRDDAVVVRLKNLVPNGKRFREAWSMEQRIAVPVTPDTRTTVPVRLHIPLAADQQPMTVGGSEMKRLLLGSPIWILEVEKKVPGVDFLASFHVPVFEPAETGAPERGG